MYEDTFFGNECTFLGTKRGCERKIACRLATLIIQLTLPSVQDNLLNHYTFSAGMLGLANIPKKLII